MTDLFGVDVEQAQRIMVLGLGASASVFVRVLDEIEADIQGCRWWQFRRRYELLVERDAAARLYMAFSCYATEQEP